MHPASTSTTTRNALVVLAVIVAGAALRWMADIITPLALALFLAIMVDGFGRVIRRRLPGLGPNAAKALAILLAAILLALCVGVVVGKAGGFIQTLANSGPHLNTVIFSTARALNIHGVHSIDWMMRHLDPTQYLAPLASAVQGFATNALFVLVYLGFLLASRHAFGRKMVRLFRLRQNRREAMLVYTRVRDGIERYLWIQTVTGAIIAAGSWLVMALVGLENALFWTFLIFLINYVPIFGAAAAIVLPALFAVVQFDGYLPAIIILAGLWTITFVVGNILLPRMQGDSLNVSPLVVLLSLAFWGALWGLTGMFLSTPLTVLTMVILAEFDGSRWIAVMLSANGDPQSLGRGSHRSPDEALETEEMDETGLLAS